MTLVAGKRRSLLTAGDDDKAYDKKPQRYAEDNKRHLIVRTSKSEAEITTINIFIYMNIKDCARCITLLKLRHEASRGPSATAVLLVVSVR